MTSIIVVNFKNPPLLKLCLKSLRENIDSNFPYEIIVVDIASTSESRNVIPEFPGVKLVPFSGNIGYTRGVNEGIKSALGDVFFIINPDIISTKGSVEKITEFVLKNPEVGLAGPQLLNFDGSIQNSSFRFYSPMTIVYRRTFLGRIFWAKGELNRFLLIDRDKTKTSEIDWIMGSALVTTRKAVDKVGLMDENLFMYMSEVDWAKRFWESGYKVFYFPESKFYHYHRRGSRGRLDILDVVRKETRWHIKDAIRYFKKHGLAVKSYCS